MSKKIMKRSLALGALMAFVITGSAWADAEPRYVEGEGNPLVIDVQETGKDRIVGGWASKDVNDVSKLTQSFSSDVTVNAGNWNMVVGGCYPSDLSNSDLNMNISSTKVVINDGVSVQHLVGGTSGSNVNNVTSSGTRTANLVINGGSFGKVSAWTQDTLENLVVGGDHIKNFPANNSINLDNTSDVKLSSTLTQISGGTFDSLVIGGSLANQYYANVGSEVLKAYVGTAETIITGGTFNKPIIAGGVAMGTNTISNVGTAKLSISNAIINSDVFTAGMVRYVDASGKAEQANVQESVVTIKDATINGSVYNTRGYARHTSSGWEFYAEDEYFATPGTGVDDFAVPTTTELALVNASVEKVDITEGSVELRVEGEGQTTVGNLVTSTETTVSVSADGDVNDAYAGDIKKMISERFNVEDGSDNNVLLDANGNVDSDVVKEATMEEGEVMGAATLNSDGTVTTTANQGNTGIKDIVATGLISWRYEMNDMNKRMGELRNANGEHGVWVRMVRGETEYNSVKNQYNQYQLGYDEKLSVDPSWTVGVALSYTEADNNFSKGTGESTNKALSIYGSKLNDDGTFIDLIAKYARLENDFDFGTAKGDYDTNGYSFSAEYGKRIQQGNGLWIEPQVELTYGQVDGATYMVGGRTVNQDNMESLIGRVGFSLGKDISKGNVYARASYLYDFEGETSATFSKGSLDDSFKQDLGGGWWEVGVGANINLSKATYIYADIEKTFGGEVDTNWQWNLGVRYSF